MKLQVKVNPETGIIDDAKFKTFGCGSGDCELEPGDRMAQGQGRLTRRWRSRTPISSPKLSLPPVKIHLLGTRGGRHQGGHLGLQEEGRTATGRVGDQRSAADGITESKELRIYGSEDRTSLGPQILSSLDP